ncbi:MAG: T9SS type A sorting domain-containing protein [Saprospiraceae bacterium]|nr:T9SS type A sorting domain-containing protein [Saprospiraceae bacterium]MBP7699582.1 T9SS type A sorting domain-containing protein [Saprospiraceae bacterium]
MALPSRKLAMAFSASLLCITFTYSNSYFWGSCGTTFTLNTNNTTSGYAVGNCEDDFNYRTFQGTHLGTLHALHLTDAMQRTWEGFKEKIISGTIFYKIIPATATEDTAYFNAIALVRLDSTIYEPPYRSAFFGLSQRYNLLTDLQPNTEYQIQLYFAAELDKDSTSLSSDEVYKQLLNDTDSFRAFFKTDSYVEDDIVNFNIIPINYSAKAQWLLNDTAWGITSSLERSYDNWHWTTLTAAMQSGTNTVLQHDDNELSEGNNYYRILLRYPDGSIGYSTILKVTLVKKWSFQLFPNPNTSDQINLFFEKEHLKPFNISIYNQNGLKTKETQVDALHHYYTLYLDGLNTGYYFIKIADQEGNTIAQGKFLKISD